MEGRRLRGRSRWKDTGETSKAMNTKGESGREDTEKFSGEMDAEDE